MRIGELFGKGIASLALALALSAPGAALAWESGTLDPSHGDFASEAKEAKAAGKRLAIIAHMDGCPTCVALDAHLGASPAMVESLRKEFVILGVDVRGAIEVTSPDGKQMTESDFARSLGVFATPTVILLDEAGRPDASAVGYSAAKGLLEAEASRAAKKGGKRDAKKKSS